MESNHILVFAVLPDGDDTLLFMVPESEIDQKTMDLMEKSNMTYDKHLLSFFIQNKHSKIPAKFSIYQIDRYDTKIKRRAFVFYTFE